jgi:hypothetical protein
VWGLPCVAHYCSTGALLPHLFTLTASSTQGLRNGLRLLRPRARFEQNGSHRSAHPQSNISGSAGLRLLCPRVRLRADRLAPFTHLRRYILCGTFRKVALTPPSRTLSGTLLCGVRTFLSLGSAARETPASATQTATIRFDISYPYYKMDSGSKGLIPHRPRPENAFTSDLH